MSKSIDDYFEALERLKKRKAKINNDTVAIEAGRKEGSIKKSRKQFEELIKAIDAAAGDIAAARAEPMAQLERVKEDRKTLERRLDESLAREIALVREVFELQKKILLLTQGRVTPIRGRKR